jgi:bacillolysin
MAHEFYSIHFNVASGSDTDVEAVGARPLAVRSSRPTRTTASRTFANEEAAARFYLGNILRRDARPSVRGITAPNRPEVVPDLKLRDSQLSPLTRTSIVRFVQTKASIPIFGSRAIVEMDKKRELLGIDAVLAEVDDINPQPTLSEADAMDKIIAEAKLVDRDKLKQVEGAQKTFFHDEDEKRWHLAYHFRNVPAAPAGFFEGLKSHGGRRSLAERKPELDYLVDAHDGTVLLYWSSSPTSVPVACRGRDEEGQPRKFYGQMAPGGRFELSDPLRRIRTFDFSGGDIDSAAEPTEVISNEKAEFSGLEGAVSAHFNAARVHDFLKSVLMRDGVDDKGMELISYINCTSPADEPPPEWNNAAWWKRRMWYGQSRDGNGRLRSFARHLDIIAHELAHGVTEFTADLAYVRQSGALNESFSDILGVIINNWDWSQPETGGDVTGWKWEIGAGLGNGGLPLRDISDPTRTGDPDHMNNYVKTPADNGGVHTNSNIHNKAAYNVLTARDAGGSAVFTPRDVAILYYLTLGRLDKIATFAQTRSTLLNVTGTYYAGDPDRQRKLDAIAAAYNSVGIS